jgi:hypothetical protein
MLRFSYLKLTALVAVFAITVVPYLRSSAASRPVLVVASTDLAHEQRIIAKYFDDLILYNKQTAQLGKKARLVNADLDDVQRRSNDLKTRLTEVQNAIREIVRKLKVANEFDDLDTNIVARITDARDKSYFQQNSFKKLLGEASNDLTSYESDITTPFDNLRRKLTSRTESPYRGALIRTHHAAVPFGRSGLQCVIANVQLGLLWRIGGAESTAHKDARICSCSGGTAATCTNATT